MEAVASLGAVSFFFQAEDGIRDVAVTGVQTCALPICALLLGHLRLWEHGRVPGRRGARARRGLGGDDRLPRARATLATPRPGDADLPALARRRSVHGGVLGEALRLLGRGLGGTLLARAGRGGPPRRRALFLPARRPTHVHPAPPAAPGRPPRPHPPAPPALLRFPRRRPPGVTRPPCG